MLIDLFKNNKITSFSLWYLKLSKIFIKKSFLRMFSLILLKLISQFSMLFASALPLKTIILMGSEKIPKYFPSIMFEYGKVNLIYFLTLASILFWILFSISEVISSKLCKKTSNELLFERYDSLGLKNQKKLVTKAYSDFIKSISNTTFCLIAFVLIFFIYPSVGYVSAIYLLSLYLFLTIVYSSNNSYKTVIRQNMITWISASSDIGFFVAFIFMIVDYLNGSMPSLFYALISVILCRQMLKGHMRVLLALKNLYNSKTRHIIDKLYLAL